MNKIITRLERRRRKLGLRQKDVAEQLGVHPSLITLIEIKRMKPYPKIRKGLARVLECEEVYLFGKECQK